MSSPRPTDGERGGSIPYALSGPPLPSYACATRCPVLTYDRLLRLCYAVSATNLDYHIRLYYAMSATKLQYAPTRCPLSSAPSRYKPLSPYARTKRYRPTHLQTRYRHTRQLGRVRYGHSAAYEVSGSDLAYGATQCPILTWLCGTELAHRTVPESLTQLCGTGLAYSATRSAVLT
eukprot:137462-Rhodomonas_salina.1